MIFSVIIYLLNYSNICLHYISHFSICYYDRYYIYIKTDSLEQAYIYIHIHTNTQTHTHTTACVAQWLRRHTHKQ